MEVEPYARFPLSIESPHLLCQVVPLQSPLLNSAPPTFVPVSLVCQSLALSPHP